MLFLGTIVSYPLGLWLGVPWLLPVLNALPAYAVLVNRLRRGERGGAVRAMLWWALTVALTGTVLFIWWPRPLDTVVIHGEPPTRTQMFHWIRSGQGAEGNIRQFLPQHLLHLAAFMLLGVLTASAGAIVMGALLMNYMSYYVAALAKAGVAPWAVMLLGWQPWAITRVAAFCTIGVLLAEPLACRACSRTRACA